MTDFNTLNELGCIDALTARLDKINGILLTLESAMNDRAGFISIQEMAKYSVTAAADMTEECRAITQRVQQLLPKGGR